MVRTWRHGDTKRGQNTRDNRHVRQRETLRCDAGGNFSEALTRSSAVHQAQCDTPLQVGHRKCGCRSRSMSISSSSSAIGMRWIAVFVIVRFFCHGPILAEPSTTGIWRDVLGEEFISGMECRGFFDGFFEVGHRCGHAVDANRCTTPGSCRRGPWWRELPIRPKTGAAMPCS